MKLSFPILIATFAPILAAAQNTGAAPITRTVDGLLNYVLYLASRALPLIILLALVWLLIGIFRLFFLKTDGDLKEKRDFIIWGIVALFVMVSVWGLVNLLRDSFNLNNSDVPVAPAIPIQRALPANPATGRTN